MSIVNEYRSTEESIKQLQSRLEALKGDPKLQHEIEFETKLKELLATYGKSLRDVIALLDPQRLSHNPGKASAGAKAPRAERKIKTYKNPHTGAIIETKGGNHKELKAWKSEHGSDTVEGWLV